MCCWRPLAYLPWRAACQQLSKLQAHLSIQPTTFGKSPYRSIDTCITWYVFQVIHRSIFLTAKRLETIQLSISTELVKSGTLHKYTGMSSNTVLQSKQRGESLLIGLERQTSLWLHEMVKWGENPQGAQQDVDALPLANNREDRDIYSSVLRFA